MKSSRTIVTEIREATHGDGYAAFHAPRWAMLLRLLDSYITGSDVRVLDIGRSILTRLIHERFGVRVDVLGFGGEQETPYGRSFWFDLNASQDQGNWRRDLPRYDVVVMGEVIEHLHTAPTLVLRFLRTLLAPGGFLIIQTPNAVSLHKRLKMLVGLHPYEMIREQTNDPGHFREYTRREIEIVAREAGFRIVSWQAHAYFDYRHAKHGSAGGRRTASLGGLLNVLYRVAPTGIRPGQTLVLQPVGSSGLGRED